MAQNTSSPNSLASRTFLGHPLGLYILFFTEMWERFSYYGMRALLMTYMVTYFRWSSAEASSVYKWYTSLVYVTPIIGGFLADRYLGNRAAVFIGAILMAIGHFLMAFEATTIFFAALLFLILGNGFFKPNMSTQVGRLYPPNDRRRDGAYTIFYMGVNLGAFLAPLICGWLQENTKGGFHAGFAIAGVGMLLGLFTYMFGQPLLADYEEDPNKPTAASQIMSEADAEKAPSILGDFQVWIPRVLWAGVAVLLPLGIYSGVNSGVKAAAPAVISAISLAAVAWITQSVKNAVRDRVTTIVVIGMFAIFFWAAFEQQGNALNLWADKVTNRYLTQVAPLPSVFPDVAEIFPDVDDNVDGKDPAFVDSILKSLGRFGEIFQLKEVKTGGEASLINPVPTAWFQSINALGIFVLAPVFAYLWVKIDLSIPAKMVAGLMLMGLSFLVMVLGAASENQKFEVTIKGALPKMMVVDESGFLKDGTRDTIFDENGKMKTGTHNVHAGRLKIIGEKIECFGVFSDLERNELAMLTTPQSFQKEVERAMKELNNQKTGGKPRHVEIILPPEVRGFDLRYGGFHPKGVEFDQSTKKLTIKQVLADKDQKALFVCAADPDFRATLDELMGQTSISRVSSQWLLWTYILATMGELCLSPVGQSMTSKLSPKRFATMLMGVWLLVSAFGNFAAGAMGEIYGNTPPIAYFGYMTLALLGAGTVLIFLVPRLTRMMHGVK